MARRSVESASKKSKGPTKKARKTMDATKVADYATRLELSLGDEDDFMTVFGEMQRDQCVSQLEAVAIGSKFVAPMPASTSRAKALERILKRHKNLMSFKMKKRAVGGRSAA